AEQIEDSVLDGTLAADAQVPSTNELAAFHRINPATAAKGINQLVSDGILYKKRGIGMFVADDARRRVLDRRPEACARDFVEPLLAEARRLGLSAGDVQDLIEKWGRG